MPALLKIRAAFRLPGDILATMDRASLSDRLARLTYLCSEIHQAAKMRTVPTERLEEILIEAEHLCRAVRQELRRRDG